jgi:hypothetical protein
MSIQEGIDWVGGDVGDMVAVPVPVAAVSVFYTPDDGRMTPETCRESLQ